MKKIVLFILVWLIMGCADLRVNTYGSGWLWPFIPYPGIGWGYRNYYYGSNGYYSSPYRWTPGYQRWVCEGPSDKRKCYWTWEPGHYE